MIMQKNNEITKIINDCFIKTIKTTPTLHSIEDLSTANIFEAETNLALNKLLFK